MVGQKYRVEQLALVAISVITKNRDDGVPWPQLLRQPHRPGNIDAAGPTHTQALLLQQVEDVGQSLCIADLKGMIYLGLGHIVGNVLMPMPSIMEVPEDLSSPSWK